MIVSVSLPKLGGYVDSKTKIPISLHKYFFLSHQLFRKSSTKVQIVSIRIATLAFKVGNLFVTAIKNIF